MKLKEYMEIQEGITTAFFISPRGEILQASNHIQMIIRNPQKFGLTIEYIKSVYDKYNEKLGTEGRAREEIIKTLVNNGWIRVRRYPNRFWSINVGRWSKKVKDLLWDWANKILKGISGFKEADPYMPVKIDVGDNYNFIKTKYTVKDIAQDILYLKEEINQKRERLKIIESVDLLKESSLSRIYNYVENYSCGAITGFRNEYTRKQNIERNKKIFAALKAKGYSVTRVKGSYIENFNTPSQKEVGETSFFVANTNIEEDDGGELEKVLTKLGEKFDQDSILSIRNGEGYLIGTSKRDDSYPGYHVKEKVGKGKYGKVAEQFFSRIRGRQFAFEEVDLPNSGMGKWAMYVVGRNILKEIGV